MKVFQIWFDKSQYSNLEVDYIPYLNKKCTVFFEAQVMRNLIEAGEHKDTDYFGVVSYKLKSKLAYINDNWKNHPDIANIGTTEFTPEKFEIEVMKYKPDLMSFQRHVSHDPISTAERFHRGFKSHWETIMKKIGYAWEPTLFNHVIYCNYFVAKSEIYERFVKEMLAPAMDVMMDMPELMGDSSYRSTPPPEFLKTEHGISHWPFHPFLCERMISYYIHIHGLNCKHF